MLWTIYQRALQKGLLGHCYMVSLQAYMTKLEMEGKERKRKGGTWED